MKEDGSSEISNAYMHSLRRGSLKVINVLRSHGAQFPPILNTMLALKIAAEGENMAVLVSVLSRLSMQKGQVQTRCLFA